jgi:hypothetical protein
MSDLRDNRSGAADRATNTKATITQEDSRRTERQRQQWGADVRDGVPTPNIVPFDDIPEGLKRERKGPYSWRTGRRVVD